MDTQKHSEIESAGAGDCIVGKSDCMMSISARTGHHWETIWNDHANAELKRLRQDPRVLFEGDRLTIPPIRKQEFDGATEVRHKFRRRGVPAKVRIRLLDEGEPIRDEPWRAEIEGRVEEGTTDGDGLLEVTVPNESRAGWLRVGEGERVREFNLELGRLDPVESRCGARSRLRALGFAAGPPDGEPGEDLEIALRQFQIANGLQETGTLDGETVEKLKQVYGS